MKYTVYGNMQATTLSVDVDAETPEEALDKFFETSEASPSICHQCSHEVELGEVFEGYVLDDKGEQVYTDAYKTHYQSHILELLLSDKTKEEIIKELTKS